MIVENYFKINDQLKIESSFKIFNGEFVTQVSKIDKILFSLKNGVIEIEFLKLKVTSLLKKMSCDSKQIIFLADQVNNFGLLPKRRRYTPEAFIIYLKMYLFSAKLYSMLRGNNILTIPGPHYIRNFFQTLILDQTLKKKIQNILDINLAD